MIYPLSIIVIYWFNFNGINMLAVFLDQETTGLDPKQHHLIEIAFKIVDLQSGKVIASFQKVIKLTPEQWEKRDPQSIEVNGFQREQIENGEDKDLVAKEIIDIFNRSGVIRGKAFFVCQNPAFDKGFFLHLINVYEQEHMQWPYHWLDLASMYWGYRVFISQQNHKEIPSELNLSKDSIASWCNLPLEDKPHRAMNGVEHLIRCYCAVLRLDWDGTSDP